AAGATRVPFNSAIFPGRLEIEGRDSERDGVAVAVGSSASIGYFRTLEIPLKAGRDFDEHDAASGAPVVVVSESFAKKYFPGEDPLGKRIRGAGQPLQRRTDTSSTPPPWWTVVGVVGDVKSSSLALEDRPAFYRPLLQSSSPIFTFVVRGTAPPAVLGPRID